VYLIQQQLLYIKKWSHFISHLKLRKSLSFITVDIDIWLMRQIKL